MSNKLSEEQSPYLLQHAHNPVHWWPWGEAAFEAARAADKPLVISIGYSACHWCHVMERESFEDEAVAAYMNEHFINVKVDREEYPDVDDFYMTAVQAITGAGGWPLNVFATPGKIPFYGGTYFPPQPGYGRPSWMQLLERMQEIWKERKEEVQQQSGQMIAYLENAAKTETAIPGETITEALPAASTATLLRSADKVSGGFGRVPKFPASMAIGFLLEHAYYTGDLQARDHALFSLDAMISGGIYDQVGGGFARYAVDDRWLVPHFEKMLYDNALLIAVLCDAYTITREARYKNVIEQTIDFVNREMTGADGGYYSALDADSEGEEGKYYTWTWQEWQAAMAQYPDVVARYFGVTETGNWEGTNILHVPVPLEAVAEEAGMAVEALEQLLDDARKHLLALHSLRIRPGTDDKRLLSWNALMNTALVKASVALDRKDYLDRASTHMEWMMTAFVGKEGFLHTWKNGMARIGANLDDLAFLAQAQLELASAAGDEIWIGKAAEIIVSAIQYFSIPGVSLLQFTSSRENNIPLRKPEIYDGVTPSSNAVMARNLYLLGMLCEHSDWIDRAEQMILQLKPAMQKHPASFAFWNTVAQRMVRGFKTVIVTGEDALQTIETLQKKLVPHCFIFFGKKENFVTMPFRKQMKKKTQIFICDKNSCRPPLDELPGDIEFTIL